MSLMDICGTPMGLSGHINSYCGQIGVPLCNKCKRQKKWDKYFLDGAFWASTKADCTRALVGCLLVNEFNHIIGTGYNGTPPGDTRSCTKGDCPRGLSLTTPGTSGGNNDFTNCIALHAEQNAVANATATLRGATAYITTMPCDMCSKLLAAAGIKRIVYPGSET